MYQHFDSICIYDKLHDANNMIVLRLWANKIRQACVQKFVSYLDWG